MKNLRKKMTDLKKRKELDGSVEDNVSQEPVIQTEELVLPSQTALKKKKKQKVDHDHHVNMINYEETSVKNKSHDQDQNYDDISKSSSIKSYEINAHSTQINSSNEESVPAKATVKPSIFSDQKFESLPISEKLKSALLKLGFEYMTEIQSKAIPECLVGNDVIGAAKTGTYSLPLLSCLYVLFIMNYT
jgi:hypothetical protein